MPKYLSPDVRNILDEIKKLRQTIKDLKNKILTIIKNVLKLYLINYFYL
jgi:hypothetical protein